MPIITAFYQMSQQELYDANLSFNDETNIIIQDLQTKNSQLTIQNADKQS